MMIGIADYRIDTWPIAVGILIALVIILWRRKRSLSYLVCFSIFGIYLLFALDKIFFPLDISGTYADTMRRESSFRSSVNVIPFYLGPYGFMASSFHGLIQNILLTIPFGFGVNFVSQVRAKNFLWLAPAIGLGIEAVQLVISLMLQYAYRVIDINDTLMNALGILIGYGAFRIFAWLYLWTIQHIKVEHRGLAAYICDIASRAHATSERSPLDFPSPNLARNTIEIDEHGII